MCSVIQHVHGREQISRRRVLPSTDIGRPDFAPGVHAHAHELFNGTQPPREGFTSVKHDAGFLQDPAGIALAMQLTWKRGIAP
jgi:hypothetical protein